MVRSMNVAQEWSAGIDWTDLDGARDQIEASHGFLLPEELSERGGAFWLVGQSVPPRTWWTAAIVASSSASV
jgi:hypothetical protein